MLNNKFFKKKQILIALGVVIGVSLVLLVIMLFLQNQQLKQQKTVYKQNTIQTAKESISGDQIWQEHLEKNIEKEGQKRE